MGKIIIVILSHYKPILVGGLEPWNFMTFHILRIVTHIENPLEKPCFP
jgi:hypothetical protein